MNTIKFVWCFVNVQLIFVVHFYSDKCNCMTASQIRINPPSSVLENPDRKSTFNDTNVIPSSKELDNDLFHDEKRTLRHWYTVNTISSKLIEETRYHDNQHSPNDRMSDFESSVKNLRKNSSENHVNNPITARPIEAIPTSLCYLCSPHPNVAAFIKSSNLSENYEDVDSLDYSFCDLGIHYWHQFSNPSWYSTNGTISISIVPPYQEDGCYFNLYYNGTDIEETFIFSKKKLPKSYFARWIISHYRGAVYKIQTSNVKAMKYGQYSFHFARNVTTRAYFYGEEPVIALNSEGPIAKTTSNSIELHPNFKAFYDCINMIKTHNELEYESYDAITIKNEYERALSQRLRCESISDMESSSNFFNLRNISVGPSEFGNCIVEHVPGENSKEDGFFNITLKQTKYIDIRYFNDTSSQDNGHLMVLTCNPPHETYSSLCPYRQIQSSKCGVTFAVPFIIGKKSPWMKNQYFLDGQLALQSTSIIAISLSIVFVASVILALIMFHLLKIRQSKRYHFMLQEFPSSFPPNQVAEVEKYQCLVEGCTNPICSHAILDVMQYLPRWVEPQMVYSETSIEQKQLLGHGQYGTVHQGLFHNGNAVWKIAIKTSRVIEHSTVRCTNRSGSGSSDLGAEDRNEVSSLMEEAKTMWKVGSYHENIVNLQGITVGVDAGTIKRLSLILEYCAIGDLRSYLADHSQEFKESISSSNTEKKEPTIENIGKHEKHTLELLTTWSYQVASGMEFLSSKNIYHGDLAARNVLLTDQLVAKVSDFGLSKRLYQNISPDDNESMSGMKLPVKWLALEVLMHGNATIKSDVWSYGVLLWEIFEIGGEPYRRGLDYRTLRDELQAGARLPNPTYSTPKISHLIQTCWLADPIERPSFTKIKTQLHQSSEISISNVDRTDNDYLTLLSDNSMYRQYKMIQESNPLFKKEENNRSNCANTNGAANSEATYIAGSYPYLEITRSELTTYTDASSTPLNQNTVFNYDTPTHLTELRSPDVLNSLLPKPHLNHKIENRGKPRDETKFETYSYHPKYDVERHPSREEINEETKCSF